MTPEMHALGQRAVACPRWRWMLGMAYDYSEFACRVTEHNIETLNRTKMAKVFLDLSDPATVGCLEALVCEAWGDPDAHLVRHHTHDQPNEPGTDLVPAVWWALAFGGSDEARCFDRPDGSRYFLAGPTRAHALVRALEAAP